MSKMTRIIFLTVLVFVAACAATTATIPPCGNNEVWNTCVNSCTEPKCGQDPSLIRCGSICDEARCVCAKGYCRDSANNCVLTENY